MLSEQITYLRLLLAEPNEPTGSPPPDISGYLFSDDQLQVLINYTESITRAAQVGWEAKAAMFQTLVDLDESGASRKLSQMFRNAINMVDRFKASADDEALLISNAVRTVGVAGAPWGKQWVWSSIGTPGTYLIGDVSRAGFGGSIMFIEVPVDPDALTDTNEDAQPISDVAQAILDVGEIMVPTDSRWPLNIEQGRTFQYWYDYVDPFTGQQVDLTGWTANLKVVAGTTVDNVALTTDIGDHRFVLLIPSSTTSTYEFESGQYEVTATDPNGNVFTLVTGTMTVSPSL